MPDASAIDLYNRPTISVDEFAAVVEIGRSSAFAAVKSGEVPHLRIGRRIRIPTAAVRRMLQLPEEAGDAA